MFSFLKSGYSKIKTALSKTRSALSEKIQALFGKPWNEETFDQLEQILFEADLGTECTTSFVDYLKSRLRTRPTNDIQEILKLFHEKALLILGKENNLKSLPAPAGEPLVFLIVGVNGSGKTTSIAKLAKHFQKEGKKVLLGAGDTFRAAAIEQLSSWAERLGCAIVKATPGSDPSAVAFDALTAAKARGCDVVFIDTAGRLQNKTDLMKELEKIRRTLAKVIPTAPHQTLLVLRRQPTGQNAGRSGARFPRNHPSKRDHPDQTRWLSKGRDHPLYLRTTGDPRPSGSVPARKPKTSKPLIRSPTQILCFLLINPPL